MPDLSIVIGDDKAVPPGDFPINFSIILDLKDDLVGVVDPAGKEAVGLGVLVFGVVPVDEGAGKDTASLLLPGVAVAEPAGFLSRNPKVNLRFSFGDVCCEFSVETGVELLRP